VRQRMPGDRYRPVGMDGSKKMKDIMNELKIPPRKRDLWPLIADQENVLWTVGFRPSKMGAPGPQASAILKVTIDPPISL
jgi:tRNA(Ile)-lysidine synthase